MIMSEVKRSASRKHIPVRTCIVCHTHDAKRALTRVVRAADGVFIDPTGKANGRGAYLCDNRECWERAVKTDVLARALRTTLTEEDRLRLRPALP